MSYSSDFRQSIENPEQFWFRQAEKIDWFKFPEKILTQDERGFYREFKPIYLFSLSEPELFWVFY
jgi:hypothetical protein